MRHELLYVAAGATCLGTSFALGFATRSGRTAPFDGSAERLLYGRGVSLAWFFTVSGYGRALIVAYAATFALAAALHRSLLELGALALTQCVSQIAVPRFKLLFGRLRPPNWLIRRELDTSFPSGHSTTAAVTFAGLVLLIVRSSLPQEVKLGTALVPAVFALGIGWSRIVLGAHYLSDVCGGYALGAAWLFTMVAILEAYGL